jgi:acyl-CoA thioesterase I
MDLRSPALKVALLLALAAPPAARAAEAAEPCRVALLGDSITAGYGVPATASLPVRLEAALRKEGLDCKVVDAGVSGDTSAGGLARLDWSLADHPDAVLLELGSNDMLRGIPPATTEKNLRHILDRLKAAHVRVLLTGMHAQRNLGADYVNQFDQIYPRLAKDYNVLFYPFILDGVALNPKLNQADGMHPNPAGVKVMVARILPLVKKLVAY